ncbi:MAG: 2-oxo acid dehydrogenase subunit E2 [Spirochaetales bacterium]|jgi:pyruvate dehydrogenase E2 component (dihydrolipoamide acetyltransferase)|nr:2-oxo acid dehydrogenase subunit E2 [Spirochaetales bacterium]
MAQIIVMPKLGLTMTEGTVTRWLKKEGESVAAGEKLYEVETDKLTNTVESPAEGVLLKILVDEMNTVACLTPVGVVGKAGEDISDLIAGAGGGDSPVPPAAPASAGDSAAPVKAASAGERVNASPAARKLAKEKGIDLSRVSPANPGARISIEDVEKYLALSSSPDVKASPLAAKMAAEQGISLADVPAQGRVMSADVKARERQVSAQAREETVPMTPMRKVIAKRMLESKAISPSVSFDISIDMTALKSAREKLAAENIKVSYTDLLVKLTAKALLEFPRLNCSVDGNSIIYKHYVNMGVAVAVEDGLLVPVVRDAHLKGLAEISAEIKSLAKSAREGTLNPDALQGGSFTITNLGMYGIESFSPIINQPEVAILGVNAMSDTVVAIDGEMRIRPVMKLSLTADHRVVDGAVAAQFLSRLKKLLEKPILALV